ncbi:hypothetical protein ACVWYH_003102 [Bradyrhizobium sp. GM24.11]
MSLSLLGAGRGTQAAIASFATFDPATVASVTLSGGNLAATNTGTTSTNQGAHVLTTSGKASGMFYFEMTYTTQTTGANVGLGIGTTASTYANMGGSATVGAECYMGSGNLYANGSFSGKSIAGRVSGDVVGVAVDLGNLRVWFKKVSGTPGNWNNDGTADPATNTGGITIPSGTYIPFVTYGGSSGLSGGVFTANFGASPFTGALPSGFTSGWTA